MPAVVDGEHKLQVRARDGALVDGTPAERLWTVDTVAPDTTITAGAHGLVLGSDDPAATFRCRVDDEPFAPCSSPYAVPATAPGTHAFEAVAADRAGNTDPTSARLSWTTPAPSTPAPVATATPAPSREHTSAPSAAPAAVAAVPAQRVSFSLRHRFRAGRFTRLRAVGVPAGTVVRVSGKCARRRGCPAGATKLSRLVGKRLQNGTTITVRAGGATRTLRIRRGRAVSV